MYQFKDLTGLTRLTISVMSVYIGAKGVTSLSLFAQFMSSGGLGAPAFLSLVAGLAAIVELIAFLAAAILFACWTYRANANAHALGGGLSVTPGWAIGWYFVPLANLFKPYLAMKETWLASHFGENWGNGEMTGMLGWWWGLWLTSGVFGYVGLLTREEPQIATGVYVIAAMVMGAATLLVIRIMQQIRDAQRVMRHAEVFA